MDKREEELKKAEIVINAILSIAIVVLTYTIAVSNPYLLEKYPGLPFTITIAMLLYVGLVGGILLKNVIKF